MRREGGTKHSRLETVQFLGAEGWPNEEGESLFEKNNLNFVARPGVDRKSFPSQGAKSTRQNFGTRTLSHTRSLCWVDLSLFVTQKAGNQGRLIDN